MGRDRRKRSRPYRKVFGSKQMHGASWTVRFDQSVLLPQRTPDSRSGGSVNTQRDRQLGRRQHLGMSATDSPSDLHWIGSWLRRGEQPMPLQAPDVRPWPRDFH